jgi:hypothetical protein
MLVVAVTAHVPPRHVGGEGGMLGCHEGNVAQYAELTFSSMHASVITAADPLPSYAVNQFTSLNSMQV